MQRALGFGLSFPVPDQHVQCSQLFSPTLVYPPLCAMVCPWVCPVHLRGVQHVLLHLYVMVCIGYRQVCGFGFGLKAFSDRPPISIAAHAESLADPFRVCGTAILNPWPSAATRL